MEGLVFHSRLPRNAMECLVFQKSDPLALVVSKNKLYFQNLGLFPVGISPRTAWIRLRGATLPPLKVGLSVHKSLLYAYIFLQKGSNSARRASWSPAPSAISPQRLDRMLRIFQDLFIPSLARCPAICSQNY